MKAKVREIYELEQMEQLFEDSYERPIFFFKHSITCPISRNVFRDVAEIETEIWLMVVQDTRRLCDAIAEKTGIRHESPQTIIVRDGKTVYHASHYDTKVEEIENALSLETSTV